MKRTFVVVGAGIVGTTIAFELFRKGYRVIVVDRGFLGSGSTGLSAGIVTPAIRRRWDTEIVRKSVEIYTELKEFYGFRMERLGFLLIGDEKLDDGYYRNASLEFEEVKSFEGFIIEEGERALFFKDAYYVDPYDFIYKLSLSMERNGVKFELMNQAHGLSVAGRSVEYLISDRGKIKGDFYVIALGAWTKKFLGKKFPVPLKPYRTQIGVLIKEGVKLPIFHDEVSHLYGRPEGERGMLVGNGTEKKEQDPDVFRSREDLEFVDRVATGLPKRIPFLQDAGYLRGWAGLCTATPNQLPLVFRYGDIENLFIVSGMNGLGVMRAPGVAELFVNVVVEGNVLEELTPKELDVDFEIEEGFR